MTTLISPEFKDLALPPHDSESEIGRPGRHSPLLVFTADERFWEELRGTARAKDRNLVRWRNTNDIQRALRSKPDAVLLDLDLPMESAWDAADALVQDEKAPPVFLITSRSGQIDFKTAIEAGSLIDKRSDPAVLLALLDGTQDVSEAICRERKAMQQLVIRWLKPFVWSAPPAASLNRFWGIND